jgi:iron complex transport system permease protein
VVYWLFGGLNSTTWHGVAVVSVVFAVCFPLLLKYSWDLNALAAGDEVAASLGVNAGRVRLIVIGVAVLLTASVICFTGIIGFVCLVAPHITRMIIGGDHRFVVPCSCIVGALLLLAADMLGRTIIAPAEIPVGIITSFVGVPLFVYLLLTRRRQYW